MAIYNGGLSIKNVSIGTATGSGNAITSLTADGNVITPNKGTTFLTTHQNISGKEDTSNKVTVWSATTNNTRYPSEKLVKDSLDDKANKSHTQGEATLTWGGGNFSGTYGPIDASMIPELGANRLAFGNPSGITIEYSRNGGSTWTDYGASNDSKVNLFSPPGSSFSIGKADSSNKATANYLLRITISTSSFGVYTALNKFMIYCSTNGSTGTYCSIDAALESTPTTFVNFANKVSISGWSGYNIINTSSITTYGNSASSQYGRLRFTFGCTGGSTTYSGLVISKIYGFGGVGWTAPSNLARTGNIYSISSGQSVTFPGSVTANGGFSGSLSGNATSATTLQTSRTINGTSFNGSANITTANWGTARNISITDSSGTNTGTAVSVNGSDNATLKLPATIKATFSGNLTGNVTGNITGSSGSCTGNAASSSSLKAGNILDTSDKVDGFLGSGVQYTNFTSYSPIGFGGNDGMILSIPWPGNTAYGVQIAFDDSTTGMVKVRGKSTNWGEWKQLWKSGDAVTGAVWNDLIDCIEIPEGDVLEPGYCYCMHEDGRYHKSEKYLDNRFIGIDSDTYSLAMGMETGKRKLNAAVSGFVLAYVDKEYPIGTALTCTENGYLTEIKKEDKCYNPEMIIATYWKNEEREEIVREDKTVKVNGRKWVKIK